jgi:hypothetical protein
LLNLSAADEAVLPGTHLHHDVVTVGEPHTDHLGQMARFEQNLVRLTS